MQNNNKESHRDGGGDDDKEEEEEGNVALVDYKVCHYCDLRMPFFETKDHIDHCSDCMDGVIEENVSGRFLERLGVSSLCFKTDILGTWANHPDFTLLDAIDACFKSRFHIVK